MDPLTKPTAPANLTPKQIASMRLAVDAFVRDYGAFHIVRALRGGQITPIINRNKRVAVHTRYISNLVEFVRKYDHAVPAHPPPIHWKDGVLTEPLFTK